VQFLDVPARGHTSAEFLISLLCKKGSANVPQAGFVGLTAR